MEIYSFETIHCLNFITQGQKLYNVTNDVKIKLLICGFARCIKNMLFLATILFIILSMCAMEFAEKLTLILLIHFCSKFP